MRDAYRRLPCVLVGLLCLPACTERRAEPATAASLLALEVGRLVDVYGLRRTADGTRVRALFARDVLIGGGIADERDGAGRDRPDEEIVYDFLPAGGDDAQPRLLIARELGSEAFDRAYAALGDRIRRIVPGRYGQDTLAQPFSVVPRDCALRLTFSHDLGVEASFFYMLEDGAITAVRNAEAVQLLRIVGDPSDADPRGDFEVIPARILPRGNQLILDPVLSVDEGVRLGVRAQPHGLPESANQVTANVRLALALEGPLAIPSALRSSIQANGVDHGGRRSLVHDFRAGNRRDDSAEIVRGFRRDPTAPRVVGEILTYLERVEAVDADTQRLTLFKRGARHRVDAGDVVRVVAADGIATGIARTEVVAHPPDDPDHDLVTVLVRRDDRLTAADPARMPGYPPDRAARDAWLVRHAPRALLGVELEAGDDPRHFVRFAPAPLAVGEGPQPGNRDVSPFAAAIVLFSKPIDMASVRALETFFFATTPLAGERGAAARRAYLAASGMDPMAFDAAKFATPHLVAAQVFDETGGQTTLRLQPPLGFYLDAALREPQAEPLRTWWVHVLGGADGIRDLAGNALALPQGDALVVDFTLDVRVDVHGNPLFADNRVVNVARRFAARDEDENPSYFRRDEIRTLGTSPGANSLPVDDLFGAIHYLDGMIQARPTARITCVADDLNQPPPPPQTSEHRWCPEAVAGEAQVAYGTATGKFGQPLQNPLNPDGCRLMTVWREVDLGLSRTDPWDFNLDVEAMYWAPHSAWPIVFDEFDHMSLSLGHSESRPENCVGAMSDLPDAMGNSGLIGWFGENFVHDRTTDGAIERTGPRHPPPHVGFRDRPLVVDPSLAVKEPNGINRFLPLPALERPCFVWRDELAVAQGGSARYSSDIASSARVWEPYLVSPFLAGGGRFHTRHVDGVVRANAGRWINAQSYSLRTLHAREAITDGLVGATALPLLADFQVFPDTADLPAGRGYIATGRTGWQIALTVEASSIPNFRVYSAGGRVGEQRITVSPGSQPWSYAAGGFNPVNGQQTPSGDNSFFWARVDFLKRQTVATSGFVDLLDPHRVDADLAGHDPRLGPYHPAGPTAVLPPGVTPTYVALFEPPLSTLPPGNEVIAQYRGAGIVDPQPWIATAARFRFWEAANQVAPDQRNFPLDPFKAGDAGIRKFDDRVGAGNRPRNFWIHPYNVHVTDYVDDPDTLTDAGFLSRFVTDGETFAPHEVRYCNWRFVMRGTAEAAEPTGLQSFALVYRLSR